MTGYVIHAVHKSPPVPHLRHFRTSLGTDCDVYDNNNEGCGVHLSDWNSFGPNFNNIGGGW